MLVEALLLLLLLLVYAVMRDRKPKDMPPGPFEIPFIGNAPLQYTDQLESYRKKYGNIYTTRIGNIRTVTFCDYKTTKDLVASVECADRPEFFRMFLLDPTKNGGIFVGNGLQWMHDRRFVLRILRDLGMGKTYLEDAINEEAQALVDDLKSLDSKPILSPQSFRTVTLNIIWQMVAGRRYDLDSQEIDKISKVFEQFHTSSVLLLVEGFFPIMKYVPLMVKKHFTKLGPVDNFRKEMTNILQESLHEHEKKLDVDNPRDLIDEYLIEMKKPNNENEENLFTTSALYEIIADLFFAGSDTTHTMIRWVVFYMVKHPEAKERCQREIDKVVARDSLVSIQQKSELPYVEAFVSEALRHSSLIPILPQRCLSKDITINGHNLPKGTCISANSYFIHNDPEFWEDPAAFKPDRFIDENGKFQAKLGRAIAFGSGRRQCPGEQLARMELFLFTAALLQNFDIELPKGAKLNEDIHESILGRLPTDLLFIYKPRKA